MLVLRSTYRIIEGHAVRTMDYNCVSMAADGNYTCFSRHFVPERNILVPSSASRVVEMLIIFRKLVIFVII